MNMHAGTFSRLALVFLITTFLPVAAAAQDQAPAAGEGGFDDRLWSPNPTAALAVTPAQTADAGEITFEAVEEESGPAPWRGSAFIYNNEAQVRGFDKSADPTWNPYWAMNFTFKPRWWFDDTWFVGARLDLSREITQADDRTYQDETWVHDLLLSTGASAFYTIPVVEIALSADLLLTTPTSKLSQARTLSLGIGPGVSVDRIFDLGPAGELYLGYHVRFSGFLHRYTTSELESPIIPGCSRSGPGGCDEFINTGERNARMRVQHGVDIAWEIQEWIGVSTGFEHIVSWLYPIEGEDPRITYEPEENTDERYGSAFYVELAVMPWDPLEIGLGYSTVSPQLQPDSTYFNPFYNRYTTVYLDLRLDIGALVQVIRGEGEGGGLEQTVRNEGK
jgi:hypothetical protein